jgi:hypothetical protein
MAPMPVFNPLMPMIELVFTVIAVFFCFLIYFKTRESYELTKHKGIRYFRDAFLFLSLSFLMRFLFSLVMFSRFAFDFIIPREMFGPFFILPLGYFSTMGIFYLIFGTIWRRFNNKAMLITGHIIAVALSVVSFITRSHIILLLLQSVFLVIAVILSFSAQKAEKKAENRLSQTKLLYMLMGVLWLINLWIIDRGGMRMHLSPVVGIFFHLIFLAVFVFIYIKVSKWVK